MSLHLRNKNEILRNIDLFIHDRFAQADEIMYPIIKYQKKCSFNSNDKRRKYNNGDTSIIMEDERMETIVKFLSQFSKKKRVKSEICFIVYIFQNIMRDNKSIFELIFQTPKVLFTIEETNVIVDVIHAVTERNSFMLKNVISNLTSPRAAEAPAVNSGRYNEIMSILKEKNFEKYKDFTISEFFNLIYRDLEAHPEISNNVALFLKTKGMTIQELKDQNPKNCTSRSEELIMMTSFSLYTFNDVDKFINLNKFCYCYPDIASLLISNKGGLFELNEANITERDKQAIGDKLGRYFNKNLETLQDDINDMNNTIKRYLQVEKDILIDAKYYQNDKIVTTDWKDFFKFMLTSFPKLISAYNIKVIYDSSSNTLFELLGLYGYICLDDDITEMTNSSGTFFQTAQYCTGQLLDVFDELKKINIENSTLWDKLKTTSIKNKKLEDLLKIIENTCIHGVGLAFLKYYLDAYESSLRFVEIEKTKIRNKSNENQNVKVKPIPDDVEDPSIVDDLFQLAPFVIKAPESLYKAINIKYLTCISYDQTADRLLRFNPLNRHYIVFGFDENNNQVKLMFLERHYQEKDEYQSIQDYFIEGFSATSYRIVNYHSLTIAQANAIKETYELSADKIKNMLDLIRIPLTFHKQRKHTFKVFADYTLNMCQLMSTTEVNDKYKELAKLSKTKFYDFMTLEESSLIPKYMTVIKLDSSSASVKAYKDAHMWNSKFKANSVNTGEPYNQNEYYVDSLQNMLMLPYVLENNKAIVKTPYSSKDITKQFQIAKLLAKMLVNDTLNKVHIPSFSGNIGANVEQFNYFETYYHSVFGQASVFRKVIFSDSEVIDGVSVVNARTLSEANKKTLKRSLFMFLCFYYHYLPSDSNFYDEAMSAYKSSRYTLKTAITTTNLKELQQAWSIMLSDIIVSVCKEGCNLLGVEYHFTELSKEYYLLVDILNTYKGKNGINYLLNTNAQGDAVYEAANLKNLEVMTDVLNKKFSYYKHEDLKLNSKIKKNDFSYYETIPRAQEYLAKIALIEEHKTRMTNLMIFEKILRFVNLDERGKSYFDRSVQPLMNDFASQDRISNKQAIDLVVDIYNNHIWD